MAGGHHAADDGAVGRGHGKPVLEPNLKCASVAALLSLATACASVPSSRDAAVAQTTPAGAQALVSDRLFFGRDIPGGGQVSDSAWAAFLAEVVTPRFPAGLTVWHGDGQWLDSRGVLEHEAAMVVEVMHAPGVPPDSVFERIATEYRTRFHQDAVIRVISRVWSLMYEAPGTAGGP